MSDLPTQPVLRHPLVRDAGVVLGWFVLIGLLGAVLWWQLTPLAEFTRTEDRAAMGEEDLGRQVAADGWYFVIAAVGGLLSGVALVALRRRDPVAMVVLVAAGGTLAGWLMLRVGLWLGPADPETALSGVAVGDKVPVQLEPQAKGVLFVWPVAALLGAIGVIWGADEHRHVAGHWSGRGDAEPVATGSGSAIRELVASTRIKPVRIREGYDMATVDALLDQVVEAAARDEGVDDLINRAHLRRVRFREAYDLTEVDRLLERVRAAAKSSLSG